MKSETLKDFSLDLYAADRWWSKRTLDEWAVMHFRSDDLMPECDYASIFAPHLFTTSNVRSIVERVVTTRRHQLGDINEIKLKAAGSSLPGKVLKHQLGFTTCTDEPRLMSNGFFDSLDIPPWDLWIAYIGKMSINQTINEDTILCWIPMSHVSLVNRVVEASFEQNNEWLSESETNYLYGST